MYNFAYHKPKNITEAVNILQNTDDAKVLAGGQTLIATMKLRLASPTDIVDLSDIEELGTISKTDKGVVIGAMKTHTQVSQSEIIQKNIPSLSYMASQIGDQMVRNQGTIGGSVANNDPAADYPAAIVGLGAKIFTNSREIRGDDFFTGMYETCLNSEEIIVNISFPIPIRSAYVKFKNPASRYAIVGVMVADYGKDVRVAVTGAGNSVFRLEKFEQALSNDFSKDSLSKLTVPTADLIEDMHAGAAYRAHLVKVMAQRAVSDCCSQI